MFSSESGELGLMRRKANFAVTAVAAAASAGLVVYALLDDYDEDDDGQQFA